MSRFYLRDRIPDLNLLEIWTTHRNPHILLRKQISNCGKIIDFDLEIQGSPDDSCYSWPERRGKFVTMPLTVSLKHPTNIVKNTNFTSNWPRQIAVSKGKSISFRVLLTPKMDPVRINGKIETYSVFSNIPYFNMSVFSPLGEVYFNTLI